MACLDYRKGDCEGETHPRESLSGTGTMIERCDKHWDERLKSHSEHLKVYPDSPIAPNWFDESLAGERWDDEY